MPLTESTVQLLSLAFSYSLNLSVPHTHQTKRIIQLNTLVWAPFALKPDPWQADAQYSEHLAELIALRHPNCSLQKEMCVLCSSPAAEEVMIAICSLSKPQRFFYSKSASCLLCSFLFHQLNRSQLFQGIFLILIVNFIDFEPFYCFQ